MICAPALAADPIGAVDAVTGECHILRGGESLAAELEQPIMLNDEIDTGEGARISILFQDETILTLDESSHAAIDDYVYSEDASSLLFKFTKGTFRTITGEIVKRNPEGFNMETPLVTIGIRGSDVYAIIQPEGEETGALHLGEGHALEVMGPTQTVRITESGMRVKISPQGLIFTPTRIPASMFNNMLNLGAATPTGTTSTTGSKTATKSLTRTTSKSTLELKNTDTDTGTTPRTNLPDLKGTTGTTGTTTTPTFTRQPTLKLPVTGTRPTMQKNTTTTRPRNVFP